LLQSEKLKSRVLTTARNLHTALIISSHAHSLCDYDTQQSVTLARSPECITAENDVS